MAKTKGYDVELETAFGDQTSVLAILGELKQRWGKVEGARARARQIEAYVYNRAAGKMQFESQVNVPLNIPQVSKNKIRGLLLTWAARTVKNRDVAIAYANEATESDLASAEAANGVMDYQRQIQDRDSNMMRACILAGLHTTIGLYTPWDPDMGPYKEREVVLDAMGMPVLDEAGGYQYNTVKGRGAPALEVLTIFDYVTSGEKDSHLGKWALIRRWMDPDEAKAVLRAKAEEIAQETGEDPKKVEAEVQNVETRNGGTPREAVEAWEIWWRPNEYGRFKDGLFAVVVGGHVVRAEAFPYDHGEIPLVTLRTMDVEDDYYGASWVEDAIPQQVGLNHSLRVLAHRAEIAGQSRLLMRSGLLDKWGTSDDALIEVEEMTDLDKAVFPVETPSIPADMYQMVDRYEAGIDDTAGVSGTASSGDQAAQTRNARLVAYATQIDEQKNEHTMRNLRAAELAVDKQQLQLYQQYVPKQRLIRIIGEDNAVSAGFFSGAEIAGVDVRLEPGPGEERSRAALGKHAEEKAQMGMLDAKSAGEMSETGLQNTSNDAQGRQKVQAQIQMALSGQVQPADPTIDPDVAIPELRLAVQQLAPQGPQVLMPLRALLQEYMELAGQGQGIPGQQPGVPQQNPAQQPVKAAPKPNPPGGQMNQLPGTAGQTK